MPKATNAGYDRAWRRHQDDVDEQNKHERSQLSTLVPKKKAFKARIHDLPTDTRDIYLFNY